MEVDDDRRAAPRGHARPRSAPTSLSGIANRYVSLKPGPNNARRDRRRRRASAPTRPPRRSTSTCCSTRSTRRRARGCATSSAAPATQYDTRGRGGRREHQVLRALPRQHLAADAGAGARPAGARALPEGRRRPRCPRSPSAATTSTSLVGNTNSAMRAIGDESVVAPAGARAAAGHAAQGQHDLREPALHARRPRPARRRVEAGHEASSRRSSARCARSWPRRGPRSPTCATLIRAPGPEQRPDRADRRSSRGWRSSPRRVFPRAIRALDRSQPVVEYARGYTPDLAGWLTKFGRGGRATTTRTATTRASCRCSARRAFDRAHNTLDGDAAAAAARRLPAAARAPTAPAAPSSPRPTARRPGRSGAATRPATPVRGPR